MAACHFDRFDGIVLSPKRGLSGRTDGDPDAGVGEFALLPRSYGPQKPRHSGHEPVVIAKLA
jgi:hypothetical protein